jgi:YVTN family beta-propeller protein
MKLNRFPILSLIVVSLSSSVALAQEAISPDEFSEPVGLIASNHVRLPINQVLTPGGIQVELPKMRPQVLALSPDGKLLATSGKTRDLVLLDPATGALLQTVPLPHERPMNSTSLVSDHIQKPDKDDQVSYTGLVFSRDGSRLYLSNVRGNIKVFGIGANHQVTRKGTIPLPEANAPKRKAEIPAGLAVSADGKRLFVAGNLSNRALELDLGSGKVLRSFDVGVAPYDISLSGHKLYVSNWGGRRPEADSVTGPAGRGTSVRVDPVRFIASEGSVSVIDLDQGTVVKEILVGLHSSAFQLTPNGRYLCVANAGGDTISVIDTRQDQVIETIPLGWQPGDSYGACPNALAMDSQGRTLFVCNGGQNAVALIAFRPGRSKLEGMIPTGWFPGAVVYDAPRRQLDIANIKGTIPGTHLGPGQPVKYNSHQHLGTLSLVGLPRKKELERDTEIVMRNYRLTAARQAFLPARSEVLPQPVPERTGEPSVFKHVVYLVKENRTYDQVLGDLKQGNGDPSLCTFGERITPNQHKMVTDFVLLDNIYCSGILSADGHQWATTGFATDYMEKSFADFPRSYPDMQEEGDLDALAYAPTGFIWDNALAHGRTVRDYGEAAVAATAWKDPANKPPLKFLDYYRDFVSGAGQITYSNYPAVDSLYPHMMTNTVGWIMEVPDVFRAAQFIRELKEFEAHGEFPNLVIICLPNDHTSGTDPGAPTPAAQVADNDLAFGQIVDAISHSHFWKETCIFAIEDDPQAGWDHVSGYRTTGYVISPYTRRHAVVSLNYTQVSILRTIELVLGLPPMNQIDAAATPMRECFTSTPDFTPYDALLNNIPLDQMNPALADIKDRRQRRDAVLSSRLPLKKTDRCPEGVLNQILWHAQMGFSIPYPRWAITETADD